MLKNTFPVSFNPLKTTLLLKSLGRGGVFEKEKNESGFLKC